jgi:hypothetical protein
MFFAKLVPLRPHMELGFKWTVSEFNSKAKRPTHFDQQMSMILQVNPNIVYLFKS